MCVFVVQSGLFQYRTVPSAIKSIWMNEGFRGELAWGMWTGHTD